MTPEDVRFRRECIKQQIVMIEKMDKRCICGGWPPSDLPRMDIVCPRCDHAYYAKDIGKK